jgi:DNA-binding HxlR family transcriptional regulator
VEVIAPVENDDPDDTFTGTDPQACPTAERLDVVGTQWRLHVLRDLQNGEVRFNELIHTGKSVQPTVSKRRRARVRGRSRRRSTR